MISTLNMILMLVCPVVCLAALAVPCWMIHKRSSKLETGLLGAVAYGVLGYIWHYMLYIFAALSIGRMIADGSQTSMVVMNVVLTVLSTVLVVASLYWGIYLTNQKQLSVYRSAAVGIGFSLGKLGIEHIYSYLYSFYFSRQMNNGTFQANSQIADSIRETTVGSMLTGTAKGLLMYVIVFALALIMGHFYVQKKPKMAWMFALCSYEALMILNVLTSMLFEGTVQDVALLCVLVVFGLAGGRILYHWFATNEVVVNPLDIGKTVKR